MAITVITPSLPERSGSREQAKDSVRAQTGVDYVKHVVVIDHPKLGPAAVRNQILASCDTEFVAFLDDDDILDSYHLELLSSSDADVVIPHCRFSDRTIPANYCNRPYDREALRKHGIFPITVLAKREAILDAGGFGDERYEDWALWNRMADNGCSFEVIPIITWTYRLTEGSRTYT